MLLKLTILTQIITVAGFVIALSGHHSVQTPLTAIVGYVVELVVSLLLRLGSAVAWLNLLALRGLSFTLEVDVPPDEREKLETVPEPFEPLGVDFQHLNDVATFLFLALLQVFVTLRDYRYGFGFYLSLFHCPINKMNVKFISESITQSWIIISNQFRSHFIKCLLY